MSTLALGGLVGLGGPPGWTQEAADRRGETPAEASLLAHANLYRAALDLPPLERDDELSWHCLLHARYQDRNNVTGHGEDPKLPGYTDEGLAAGQASVLAYTDPERSVDMWMDSFLHRIPVITPTGARTGVGWNAGTVTCALLDTRRGADTARGRTAELHWPPDGMTGVPTRMSREQPNPTPYPSSDQAGYPVTCTFHPARRVTTATARLWMGFTAIAAFFSAPDQPTRAGAALQQNTICLIPEKPLPAGKVLRVEMTAAVDGAAWRAEWSFTTGSRTAGRKWMEQHRATAAAQAAAAQAAADRAARRDRIADEKEARRTAAIVAGVLQSAPDAALARAIADARETLGRLPERVQPDLARPLRSAEARLTALVDARLAARDWAAADALAGGLAPWAARVAEARAAAAGTGAAGDAASGTAAADGAGWQVLLTDRLDNAWTGPVAHAGHLRREDGALSLVASQSAVAIAYLYFTDDWTNYEVEAEVQITTGAALVLRAQLKDGEYQGHYLWLDPTPAGEWVTLNATVSGTAVKLRCGRQALTETTTATAGGLLFSVQPPDERLKIRNVRVRK